MMVSESGSDFEFGIFDCSDNLVSFFFAVKCVESLCPINKILVGLSIRWADCWHKGVVVEVEGLNKAQGFWPQFSQESLFFSVNSLEAWRADCLRFKELGWAFNYLFNTVKSQQFGENCLNGRVGDCGNFFLEISIHNDVAMRNASIIQCKPGVGV